MAEIMAHRDEMIHVWSPRPKQLHGRLGKATASCLAAAFSSGEWARTPMPLGNKSDPHSAHGIIAQLGKRAEVLVANDMAGGHSQDVLACVLGAVLDEALVDAYGLDPYGARSGDALLAYIGLAPAIQGRRAYLCSDNKFKLSPSCSHSVREGQSLAALMFEQWLTLPAIECCRRAFVRTRKVLAPIIHLAEKNDFRYRGEFELDFHGERQDRIVFVRDNPLWSRFVDRSSVVRFPHVRSSIL